MLKALPTVYKGVQYRSLLEARWAAWFDLAGIVVHYEPEAFNGYIPDFLWLDAEHPEAEFHVWNLTDIGPAPGVGPGIVFEVKGVIETFDVSKIHESGWAGPVCLLDGRGPAHAKFCSDDGRVFQLAHADHDGWMHDDPQMFLAQQYGLFDEKAARLWREAGNLVQWRSPRRRVG